MTRIHIDGLGEVELTYSPQQQLLIAMDEYRALRDMYASLYREHTHLRERASDLRDRFESLQKAVEYRDEVIEALVELRDRNEQGIAALSEELAEAQQRNENGRRVAVERGARIKEKLLPFVEEVAEHGLGVKLNPTYYSGGGADMYSFMASHFRSADAALRERARAVLEQ